jgi:carbon-monoxide dehydrogenase large subunit
MAVVRSDRMRGWIVNLTRRAMPGVGAFVATDLPEMENRLNDPVPAGLHGFPRPVLAHGTVRYVGEPIAVVVADNARLAVDATQAVEVDVTPLDGSGDVLTATSAAAPVLHAELGSNVAGRYQTGFGDITAAFAGEATIVRWTFA